MDYRVQNDGTSFRPRIFQRNEAENNFDISTDNTETITIDAANPLVFNYTATLDAQVNSFSFQVQTALTNVRARIVDTATSVPVKNIPSIVAWESGSGGLGFGVGTMTFDLGVSQMINFVGDQFTIEIRADSGAVLGNNADFPAVSAMVQRGEFVDLGYQFETQESGFKRAARAATTANVTLSAPQTIDGVSLVAGDRVLVKNQTDASENGIYLVAAGAWTRALDANTNTKLGSGVFVPVSEGTANADTLWQLTTNDPITLDTTNLTFTEHDGAAQVQTPRTFKRTARVVSSSNLTLSGLQTIDGVALAANDRVLVNGQTDAADNGIYVASANAWVRATDANSNDNVFSGIFVPVSEGTVDNDTLWMLTTNDPITLDTTGLTFREFSGVLTTFEAPVITALSISGLTDPTPPVGTSLGGTRTITYTVSHTENVQGTLTFLWDNVAISTTVDAAAGSATVTIPATTTVAGVTHTGRLQGTNTRGDTFSRDVTFRSASDHELGYYGTRPTNDFASVDVSNLSSVDVTQSGTVFTVDALNFPNTQFFGILLPEDRELVSLTNPAAPDPNRDIRNDFTTTTNARVIGGTNYTLYTEQNNSGFDGSLSLRATTE